MYTPPPVPEITDDFLRQGAEYLICHADPIFNYKEEPDGPWADWESYLAHGSVCRSVWLWMTRNLPELATQYSDDEWAGFVWQTCVSSMAHSLRYALSPYDDDAAEIATFMQRFYELILLPRCSRDSAPALSSEKTASKLESACYMIGDDFNYLDNLPDPARKPLMGAVEYALNSPSFTLQHSALHALGHFHFSKDEQVKAWRTSLITDWLGKYDSGAGLEALSAEEQQKLRRSAFLVEPSGKKSKSQLSYGRVVPQELVFYARAALQGTIL